MSIGFRILNRTRVAPRHLVEAFARLPVAAVSDVMHRMSAAGPTLRPMHRDGRLAGVALTVRTRPGDNLMLHKAIDMAGPGDVVVCEAGGVTTNALMGELMLARAIRRGIAGLVLDGAIRDRAAFRERNLPVFAAGVTHRGPYKDGPGEINVPVALGGMVVHPGDIVLGDSDGVLAVPLAAAEEILRLATEKHAAELRQLEAIERGTDDRGWVDRLLRERGCSFPDDEARDH